jgi:DNA invertase Pin-like site-specific DNA recombinase
MKVAIYCRVSTKDQNAGNQENACKDYCQRINAEIFNIYTDSGVSGAKTSRPAFDEMLRDMRLVRFNTIMVTKLDRIGRSLQHVLSLFDEFNRKGIQFVAITQNIDTSSAAGKMQMQLLGVFAEFERNLISERMLENAERIKHPD